jgi:hydroxyacylglutathione hydrolase
MALVFEQLLTAPMGDASYLVGDDSASVAAIVDPQVEIDRYLTAARRHGLAIRYVVQTHVHEDFVSGAHALAVATGATLCVSGHDASTYGFPHRLVHDGDEIAIGALRLTVRHTPGHTPEHVSLLLANADRQDAPFAVLSGGSLLVDAAGRTDLLGEQRAQELTRAQFRTLTGFYLALDDGVMVYPTHVHGSPCGAAIGDKIATTIGYERRHNSMLQHADEASFARAALADLPPKPRYYPRLKETNTSTPPARAPGSARPLPPSAVKALVDQGGHVLLDTRHQLAFGGAHIPGAWNIGASGHFSIQAGWMLDPERPLLLVLESDAQLATVLTDLARTGLDRVHGYLAGGMSAWEDAGYDLQPLPQLHVRALQQQLAKLQVLDVRSPQEWQQGHVPGARHIFLGDLQEQAATLDRQRPVAVYCDSGYRASIAASVLQSRGFDVRNVPGSWQAWQANQLPEER